MHFNSEPHKKRYSKDAYKEDSRGLLITLLLVVYDIHTVTQDCIDIPNELYIDSHILLYEYVNDLIHY